MIWYLQAFLPALVATVFVIVRLKAAVRGERQAPLEHKAVSDALALKAMADGDCETNPKIANPTADDEETAMLRHEKAGRTAVLLDEAGVELTQRDNTLHTLQGKINQKVREILEIARDHNGYCENPMGQDVMDGLQDDQDTHELLGVLDELRRICSSRAEAVSLRTFDVWRKRWKEKQRLTQHRRAAQAHGTELALKNFTQSVREWDRDRHVLDAGFDATIQCVCMIFMLLYVQVMSTIVQPMDCTLQDDGRWYLDAYPKVVCYDYTIEAGWVFLIYPAWAMFFLFGLGYPCFLLFALGGANTPDVREKWLESDKCQRRYGWVRCSAPRASLENTRDVSLALSLSRCTCVMTASTISGKSWSCSENSSSWQPRWPSLTNPSSKLGRASC